MSHNWESLVSPTAVHGDAVAGVKKTARANVVLAEIDSLKKNLVDGRWDLAELLEEVHDNDYHQERGFNEFDEYIDQSNFDVGSREARYLIKISRNSKKIGVTREQLKAVNISKLKEIFTLNPDTQADHIKRLVVAAVDMSLTDVRKETRACAGLDGEPEFTFRNFKVLREAAESVVDPAIERVKREAGDTVDEHGQPKDISDGQALVLMCADKNAEPDWTLEELEDAAAREQGDNVVDTEGPTEA